VNCLTCQVFISGAKAKENPETQKLARAIADVFGSGREAVCNMNYAHFHSNGFGMTCSPQFNPFF